MLNIFKCDKDVRELNSVLVQCLRGAFCVRSKYQTKLTSLSRRHTFLIYHMYAQCNQLKLGKMNNRTLLKA